MARKKILKGGPTRLYHTEESRRALESLKTRALIRDESTSEAEIARDAIIEKWKRVKP